MNVKDLELVIQRHNALYYNEMPEISDEVYDGLVARLEEMDPNSPLLSTIGSPVSGDFDKVRHTPKMYSLNDKFNTNDVAKWSVNNPGPYVAEVKLDGLAIEIRYEKGLLVQASTLGDGDVGDDVTHTIKTIQNVPWRLTEDIDLTVRGECIIPRNKFKLLEGFANARNAAAGSVRLKDPSEAAKRHLAFFAYSNPFTRNTNHVSTLSHLTTLGFSVVKQKLCERLDDVFKAFKDLDAVRDDLPFDIDGMAIKVNNHDDFERAGYKGRYPVAACAWKFEAPAAITEVESIIVSKGRTGNITPIAVLRPVVIAGSTITRASLFNQAEIDRLGVYIGAMVEVKKAGDIIPQVVKVINQDNRDLSVSYELSRFCPDCGGELDTSNEVWRCPHFDCSLARQIEYMCSINCLNIKGLGRSMIEQLVRLGRFTRLTDVFRFNDEDFQYWVYEMHGWGEGRIDKIADQVKDLKITTAKLYQSLGIPTIGEEKSKLIADIYINPYDLIDDFAADNLYRLRCIGDVSYFKLIKWLKSNWALVRDLTGMVTLVDPSNVLHSAKTFVFTGKLEKPRNHYKSIIEESGNIFGKSLNKSTDYLVVADPNSGSSKIVKAKKYGTTIISVKEFEELI